MPMSESTADDGPYAVEQATITRWGMIRVARATFRFRRVRNAAIVVAKILYKRGTRRSAIIRVQMRDDS